MVNGVVEEAFQLKSKMGEGGWKMVYFWYSNPFYKYINKQIKNACTWLIKIYTKGKVGEGKGKVLEGLIIIPSKSEVSERRKDCVV